MEPVPNQSEVARLLDQIEATYTAARRGLVGFAESAKHQAITAKMEHMARIHEQLKTLVGEDEAAQLLIERLETITEEGEER